MQRPRALAAMSIIICMLVTAGGCNTAPPNPHNSESPSPSPSATASADDQTPTPGVSLPFAGGPLPSGAARADRATFQRGLVLGMWDKTEKQDYSHYMAEMAEVGADSVSLMVNLPMADIRANEITRDSVLTTSDEVLSKAVRDAHAAGLRVFLLITIHVRKLAKGEWRGKLAPASWDEWFANYRREIGAYAALAEALKIEWFCIGSELGSSEPRVEDWRGVVADVRKHYTGKITYSTNWDNLREHAWYGDLDALGMNAYFELSNADEPTLDDLIAGWKSPVDKLRAWSRAFGDKPIVITEIGYPAVKGGARWPWWYTRLDTTPDDDLQALCFEAFARVFNGEPLLTGVYFYNWYHTFDPTINDYTPAKKPAERVLRGWYGSFVK
jgi:hypothetical protein